MKPRTLLSTIAACVITGHAMAAVEIYTIDPVHTYPSVKASHMHLSYWRGKFEKSSGSLTLDLERGIGAVNVTIDVGSIDFGFDPLNEAARSEKWFDVKKFPAATYKSNTITFKDGVPVAVDGQLTLRGITKPVLLKIDSFKCIVHPVFKREVCGADAYGELDRVDFGMTADVEEGTKVSLEIQIEAIKGTELPKVGALPR